MSNMGGARPGAGRPKGTRNKASTRQIRELREKGMTPLDYLTSIYTDPKADEKLRIDAAKAAAPYVHAKLSNVEMNSNVTVRSHEEWLNELK